MLENISQGLQKVIKQLRGQAYLTEANMMDAFREVRIALLEADVALPVVKDFIDEVKKRAIGQAVLKSLTPGQAVIEIVHRVLIEFMGESQAELNLATKAPAIILIVGLQGTGKTTTASKLAYHLKEQKKKVLLCSTDIYRPAAMTQLELLAQQIGVDCWSSNTKQEPLAIAQMAHQHAQHHFYDVLIVDSAGRLTIDEFMMNEIKTLQEKLTPIETLFVVDAMQGQDALNTAKAFNETLTLSGIILTKLDGDARGGCALSARYVTQKPIKFIGVSEKPNGLEVFYPERMASRILGMGDMLGLIEETRRHIDTAEAEKLERKLKSGQSFDLNDFKNQMAQMRNLGGLSTLMDKLPGDMAKLTVNMGDTERSLKRIEGMINSMTPLERTQPEIIKATRKKRIAQGAGVQVQEVNRLLNQFLEMQKMMKLFGQGGMGKLLRGMSGLGKNLPGMRRGKFF